MNIWPAAYFLVLLISPAFSAGDAGLTCELDQCAGSEAGGERQCLDFHPATFPESPSVFTYLAGGRLGNRLTSYLNLFWLKLDMGLDVYCEQEVMEQLDLMFENVRGTVKVLELDLCDWKSFPFERYEGNIELLGGPQWRRGKAVNLYIRSSNFMRHEIQGGRRFMKDYRKQSMHALRFRSRFADHARSTLLQIASQMGTRPSDITFVAFHNRRTDYLHFRRRVLKMPGLHKGYFEEAMEYFVREYSRSPGANDVAFVYVSDDMGWGKGKISRWSNVFPVGCGDADDHECVAKDFAVLAHCNHTILTHGSFGTWAAYFTGGEFYTEYGAIMPYAHQ